MNYLMSSECLMNDSCGILERAWVWQIWVLIPKFACYCVALGKVLNFSLSLGSTFYKVRIMKLCIAGLLQIKQWMKNRQQRAPLLISLVPPDHCSRWCNAQCDYSTCNPPTNAVLVPLLPLLYGNLAKLPFSYKCFKLPFYHFVSKTVSFQI